MSSLLKSWTGSTASENFTNLVRMEENGGGDGARIGFDTEKSLTVLDTASVTPPPAPYRIGPHTHSLGRSSSSPKRFHLLTTGGSEQESSLICLSLSPEVYAWYSGRYFRHLGKKNSRGSVSLFTSICVLCKQKSRSAGTSSLSWRCNVQ